MRLVAVRGFLCSEKARPLDLDIPIGAKLAIMGPSRSGKARLAKAIFDAATKDTETVLAAQPNTGPRVTPENIAKRFGTKAAGAAITDLGVWDDRKKLVRSLPESAQDACALLEGLAMPSGLLVVNRALDKLDPWRLEIVLDRLVSNPELAVVVTTNRADIAERLGQLCVISSRGLRFMGSPRELIESVEPATVRVLAKNSEAVAMVAQSLGVRVTHEGPETTLKLDQGLQKAVQLALQGYGNVEAITVRRPTLAEALTSLFSNSSLRS